MRLALAAGTALLLVACGGQNETGNESAAGSAAGEAGGAVPATAHFEPGEWEITTEVTRISMPDMPQGMTPPMPPPTTVRNCLTEEQARRPDAGFMTGSGETGGCTYRDFSMADGRIQGTVQCTAQGASMQSSFGGQFTPTSYEMTQQVETSGEGMRMEMESRTAGRRIGDCPAK